MNEGRSGVMVRLLWWLPRILLGLPLCVLVGLVTGPIDVVYGFFERSVNDKGRPS